MKALVICGGPKYPYPKIFDILYDKHIEYDTFGHEGATKGDMIVDLIKYETHSYDIILVEHCPLNNTSNADYFYVSCYRILRPQGVLITPIYKMGLCDSLLELLKFTGIPVDAYTQIPNFDANCIFKTLFGFEYAMYNTVTRYTIFHKMDTAGSLTLDILNKYHRPRKLMIQI